MKLINLKHLLILLLLFLTNLKTIEVHAQIYTDRLHGHATLNPDSLFVKFEKPKLPVAFYKKFNSLKNPNYQSKYKVYSLNFICEFGIDFSNKVKQYSLKIHPIYNYGNNIPIKHNIWKKIIANIKNASKNWVTKKLLWDINKYPEEEAKEIRRQINEGKFTPYHLPSSGSQSHIMILTINPESEIYCDDCDVDFNFIYRIEIYDLK